jgi:hypothetical protein
VVALWRSQRGYTALIRAAANGHTECVELLVNAGADTEAIDNVRMSHFCNFFEYLGLSKVFGIVKIV